MTEIQNYSWKSESSGFFLTGSTALTDGSRMSRDTNVSSLLEPRAETYNWGFLLLTPVVLFGITGNVLVCMAVSMEKRLQTVTNYFLLSLAVTDLLVCIIVMPIGIINDFFGYWPFRSVMCNVYVTGDVLMCTSSILHLCSISLQRYLAIRSPLKPRNKSKSVVLLKVTTIWVAAATITSPITVLGIIDQNNILNNKRCILKNNDFIIYGSILAFCIPLVIMVLSYALTIRLLHKQARLYATTGSRTKFGQPVIRRSRSRRRRNGSNVSIGQSSIEMGSKSRSTCNINIAGCGENLLQIPTVLSHTTSCDAIFSTVSESSPSRSRTPTNNCFLNVPSGSNNGSSTESLISENENSTDEDNKTDHLIQDNGSNGTRSLKHAMAKQLIVKATSILNLSRERNHDKMAVRTEQKASKVLGFVFFIFVVCWSPFFAMNILSAICKPCTFNPILISVFVWLGWISSTINPIIYTMFNSTFKQTFIKLLRCQYGFLQRSTHQRQWKSGIGYMQKISIDSNMEIPLS